MKDFHTHSNYSFDGKESIEHIVQAAIAKGITTLAITDHFEVQNGVLTFSQEKLTAYIQEISALKTQYKTQITLLCGLEVGYVKKYATLLADALKPHNFDYIINSVHEVGGDDCYFEAYFKDKIKETAYGEYLEAILDSLDAPYPFHTIGHIGYVCRNAPYSDPSLNYIDFKDIIDKILRKIIAKNKALELNPNVSGKAKTHDAFFPNLQILTAYKNMGGKKVIFGSDAHTLDRLGDMYHDIIHTLKKSDLKFNPSL